MVVNAYTFYFHVMLLKMLGGMTGIEAFLLIGTLSVGLLLMAMPVVRSLRDHKEKAQLLSEWNQVLENISKASKAQVQKVWDAFGKFSPEKGLDFDVIKVKNQEPVFPEPDVLLEKFKPLLSEKNASRIVAKLTEAYNQAKCLDNQTPMIVKALQEQNESYLKSYFENIFALAALYDQLQGFVQGKKLNAQAEQWVTGYFQIFEQWNAQGAIKDPAVLQKAIVEKVLALNQGQENSPFVVQTTEKARNCALYFEKIAQTTQETKHAVFCYAAEYQRTARVARISAHTPIQPSGGTAMSPIMAGIRANSGKFIAFGSGILLFALLVNLPFFHEKQAPNTQAPLYAGHSIPAPNDTDKIESFSDHYNLIKPLMDSIKNSLPEAKKVNFEPLYGIDVSYAQERINWASLSADTLLPTPLHFAIIKVSQGAKKDDYFDQNWQKVQKTTLKPGGYHLLQFDENPVSQAHFFIQTSGLQKGHIRPILDLEANCKTCDPIGGLTKQQFLAHVRAYLAIVEEHYHCKAIIYCSHYYYHQYVRGNFPENIFWLAEYSRDNHLKAVNDHLMPVESDEKVVCWQFTSKGVINGVKNNVDLDFLPGHFRDLMLIPEF